MGLNTASGCVFGFNFMMLKSHENPETQVSRLHCHSSLLPKLCPYLGVTPLPHPPDRATALPGNTPADFKAEMLSSLCEEMVGIFRAKLQATMPEMLLFIESEHHTVKTELTTTIASIKSNVNTFIITISVTSTDFDD